MSSKSLTRKDDALQQIVRNGCKINLLGPSSWNREDLQPLLQQVCTSVLEAGIVCFIKESDNVVHANDVEGHTHVLFLVHGSPMYSIYFNVKKFLAGGQYQ